MDLRGLPQTKDELLDVVNDAVFKAMVNERLADHESRLVKLEQFRIWLLTTVAIGSLSSLATLAMQFTLHKGAP